MVCRLVELNEPEEDTEHGSEDWIKVTGYHEGAWFKNNFAKVFFACNYYAGVATTSNAVSFRSL